MSEKQSWSVFVPCYNEGDALSPVIDKIAIVMDAIASDYEIVIIDDGSVDNSPDVIMELKKKHQRVSSVFHGINKGIGEIQRKAYTTSKFENVIVIGGDGQFDPKELKAYPVLNTGTWLSFYRQQLPSYTVFRKILSGANRFLNKLLFDLELKDVNWAMVFKSAEIKKIDLQLNSTLIKSEVCIKLKLLGYKAVEIPSTYHLRTSGQAKGASIKIICQAAKEILKLRASVRKFKRELSLRKS